MSILSYLFYPNPANSYYTNPKALSLIIICAAMVLGSFALKKWRTKLSNPSTKKLSRSWSGTMFWFGLIGLFLVVSRVEEISYVSMRFWWLVWSLSLLIYVALQAKVFRARHYNLIPQEQSSDPRDKYLPKKKR